MPAEERASRGLQIYTLGRFALFCKNESVADSESRAGKTWSLFRYLITHRDRAVPTDVILDTFWPAEKYANPTQAFYTAVHRLRRLLDPSLEPYDDERATYVCMRGGMYQFNTDCPYWLDAEAFERLSTEARCQAALDPDEAIRTYQRALALYKGDYLIEHLHDDWAKSARQHYQGVYRRAVIDCVKLLLAGQRHEDARQLCEKALTLHPLEEEYHLALLEVLIASENLREARTWYEESTSRLYLEAGIRPSPKMRSMARQISATENQVIFDLPTLGETLRFDEDEERSFFCDPETFRRLYNLEVRRMARTGASACLVSFRLTSEGRSLPRCKELEAARDVLGRVLKSSLRRGDILCRWSEVEFVAILSGATPEKMPDIEARIRKRYSAGPVPVGVSFRVKYRDLRATNFDEPPSSHFQPVR